jgi:hypothetical protein
MGRETMPASGIKKVTALQRAITSKDPDLATTYIDPDRYVEHMSLGTARPGLRNRRSPQRH